VRRCVSPYELERELVMLIVGFQMLVLGRPGSGCTTFLKAVANKRASFKSVEGEVFYGNMNATEAEKYRGSILYNSEGEIPAATTAAGRSVSNHLCRRHAFPHLDSRSDAQICDQDQGHETSALERKRVSH